jgi:hypothetical protein
MDMSHPESSPSSDGAELGEVATIPSEGTPATNGAVMGEQVSDGNPDPLPEVTR